MSNDFSCAFDTSEHCITCSDAAIEVRVLSIDTETGLACVVVKGITEEIDVSLVENATPGDLLLVHGGVAIAHLLQYPLTDRSNEENLTPLPDSIDADDSNRTSPNRSSGFAPGEASNE